MSQTGAGWGRRLFAEGAGTAMLVAVVIGSGIMGQRLADGNAAIALLGNTIATGAGLVVLITIFGPISGAHFNPAVTLFAALRREFPFRELPAYAAVQILGGLAGALLANLMFGLPLIQASTHVRSGIGQWIGEIVATLALLAAIVGSRRSPAATPYVVGLVICAGYWFTSSTSFANPAVTIARSISDTFAGIRPVDVPGFVLAQLLATFLAVPVFSWLFGDKPSLVPVRAEPSVGQTLVAEERRR
jgi:glycerol uptake facilitator-like aquaporin